MNSPMEVRVAAVEPAASAVVADIGSINRTGEPVTCWDRCSQPVVRRCFLIVTHKSFDHIVLALVLLNSIGLACDDPTGQHPERQNVIAKSELVFLVLFSIELMLKSVAYGCGRESGYLASGWNRLDALIVALGYVELIAGDSAPGFSALRCFRALRPLRTINKMPLMKVIINTLLLSMPQLFHVVQLCFLVYLLFALIALQVTNSTLSAEHHA